LSAAKTGNPFSAAGAALGYLYQVRSALLWTLRRQKVASGFLVSIETLDDVAFETTDGTAPELLQTKHHRNGVGALSDASVDLWKTLRIWFEGHASALIPENASLCLVTTGVAPEGSAASRLGTRERDVSNAQHALDAIASSSTNNKNKSAYAAYLGTEPARRALILDRVVIFDAAPTAVDLASELKQEVYWAAPREHHEAFLARLEGWWFERVLRQLANADGDRIGSIEIEAQMSDLREQFQRQSLPIDVDVLEATLDDATKAALTDTTFVRQLEIISAGKSRITSAIRDYYRAFQQRSRWLREDLVVDLDLHRYERRLIEAWELTFDAMKDDLGEGAAEEAKSRAARGVLAWAESASIPIRVNVTEPFVSRGSFHILSDSARIGWHPEFSERLKAVLESKQKGAA